MGNIKTKKHNRLKTKKLRDIAFVKTELRHQHTKTGEARRHLKRHFGSKETTADMDKMGSHVEDEEIVRSVEESVSESDTDSGSNSESESEGGKQSVSFRGFVRQLDAAVKADEDGEDVGDLIEGVWQQRVCTLCICAFLLLTNSFLCKIRVFFGQKHLIPIADLFDWSKASKLDGFWDQGNKHYNEEMEFYELVTRLNHKRRHGDIQRTSDTVGASVGPITIDDSD